MTAPLREACRQLPPIGLDHLVAVADLQTRTDRKYLVPAATFLTLVDRLGQQLQVLDIGGRRVFGYESGYFDTTALLSYHQHAYGRRRRFKVRTRSYLDTGQSTLEIKTRSGRGETVKDRHPYPSTERYRLTPCGRDLVAARLPDPSLAAQLRLTLVNRYQRATLVDTATGNRMTCDVGLSFWGLPHRDGQRRCAGPPDRVLIESKSTGAAAPVDAALWRLGYRPIALSKYCVGLALLYPQLPANRWHRTLCREFGHARTRCR